MNTQKRRNTLIVLAIALMAVMGAFAQPAAASHLKWYSLHPGKTIALGKQGLAVTNVPHGATAVAAGVTGETMPKRFDHNVNIDYRAPVMEIRFLNDNGGIVHDINALVYVFFNIGKAERSLWLQHGSEKIAIWYYNETENTWEMCPTFYVNENRDNGTYDRLACIAPGSGFYVLGHVGFDELLFTPYTYDGMRVLEWKARFGMQ